MKTERRAPSAISLGANDQFALGARECEAREREREAREREREARKRERKARERECHCEYVQQLVLQVRHAEAQCDLFYRVL